MMRRFFHWLWQFRWKPDPRNNQVLVTRYNGEHVSNIVTIPKGSKNLRATDKDGSFEVTLKNGDKWRYTPPPVVAWTDLPEAKRIPRPEIGIDPSK